MTHLDPDQVSTEATRCLLGHRNDRATGEYVVSSDRTVLLELEGDRDRLTAYVAERHELTPSEADEQITVWLQGAVPADVVLDETRDNEQIRASGAHIPVGEDVYSDDRDFGDDDVASRPIGRDD